MSDAVRPPADLQRLTGHRSEQSFWLETSDNVSGLTAVAEEFESFFVEKLLQSAREAELSEGLLDSQAQETFQGLLDREFAGMTAKQSSLGIADALVAQFRAHVGSSGPGED